MLNGCAQPTRTNRQFCSEVHTLKTSSVQAAAKTAYMFMHLELVTALHPENNACYQAVGKP